MMFVNAVGILIANDPYAKELHSSEILPALLILPSCIGVDGISDAPVPMLKVLYSPIPV